MFTAKHYSERATELESAAKQVSNPRLRASYLEIARRFRRMARLAGSLRADESVQLAERMIGRALQRTG